MMTVEVVRKYIRLITMSTSIRNRLPGKIEKTFGQSCVRIVIQTAAGTVTSIITTGFVERMKLKEGDDVFAVIRRPKFPSKRNSPSLAAERSLHRR